MEQGGPDGAKYQKYQTNPILRPSKRKQNRSRFPNEPDPAAAAIPDAGDQPSRRFSTEPGVQKVHDCTGSRSAYDQLIDPISL
jgi:hypothetical protein